jgi:hypothetical protein
VAHVDRLRSTGSDSGRTTAIVLTPSPLWYQ